jgi:hypothetical protein
MKITKQAIQKIVHGVLVEKTQPTGKQRIVEYNQPSQGPENKVADAIERAYYAFLGENVSDEQYELGEFESDDTEAVAERKLLTVIADALESLGLMQGSYAITSVLNKNVW